MPLTLGALGWIDWGVLGAYGLLLLVSGLFINRRRQHDTGDYFLAKRSMPSWAVAISVLATAQSAATFVGVPESAYYGNLTYLSGTIGGILAAVVLAWVFIPAFYRHECSTPYQLLECRFGVRAKHAASVTYLIGRVFAGGARVFIGSVPASLILFGDVEPLHLVGGVVVMTTIGIGYTLAGGIRSVIWSDVLQATVYVGAAGGVLVYLVWLMPSDWSSIIAAWREPGTGLASKLTLIDVGIDPGKPLYGFDASKSFTLLTSVTGLMLLIVASHGTDQDLVQRMLTCRSAKEGARSVIGGVLAGVPTVAVFLAIGLLLWVFYQRPDLTGRSVEAPSRMGLFVSFVMHHLPPGLGGLVMTGLFAAGLSTVNSTLNAMSSTFVTDLYRGWRPGHAEGHYLRVARGGVVGAGVVLGGFASLCILWYDPENNTLVEFALGVMSFAYAGLLGVFLTALFTTRGSERSAVAALIAGFVVVLVMQPAVWGLLRAGLEGTVTLPEFTMAFPWQLVIGTCVATLVCLAGRGRKVDPVAHGA